MLKEVPIVIFSLYLCVVFPVLNFFLKTCIHSTDKSCFPVPSYLGKTFRLYVGSMDKDNGDGEGLKVRVGRQGRAMGGKWGQL